MPQTVDLSDVISSAVETALQGVWTALPGRVEAYDAERQTARIQLAVRNVHVGEDGERVRENIAPLPSVPVIHLGGGGFRTVYPVQAGDTALVIFASRAIGPWLASGDIVDPDAEHHHDLSDGVAIVGLRDLRHALASQPTNRMSIGKDDGPTIEIDGTTVQIGGSTGTQPTFRGGDAIDAITEVLRSLATAIEGLPGGSAATGAITEALGKFAVAIRSALTTITRVK